MTETDRFSSTAIRLRSSKAFAYVLMRPWIPLALGFLVVLAVGIVTTRTVAATEVYNQEVREALVTIGVADEVLLSMLEMNSAQRGYIISRDPGFRDRYANSRRLLDNDLAKLRALIVSVGVARADANRLDRAISERLAGFERIERLLAVNDHENAARYSAGARFYTDEVRSAIAAVKASALERLANRQLVAAKAGQRAFLLTIAGLTIASLLILGAIMLLARRSQELQKANDEVRGLAATLEQRVAERTADLAEANDEIQRFAYIVSHDLRSPLVNIMGFTAELEEAQQAMADFVTQTDEAQPDAVPADARAAVLTDMPEAMGFIRASTARMDRLIKAILQISREGRRTLTSERIDLDALFSELADSLSGPADTADARIHVGALPVVDGDRLALEQVFGNLLDNAIKYLRPGVPGRISVTGEAQGNRAIIRVRDNGRGVAEADRRRIFELFRRAGEQDRPGEGIGLAHVQALVRRLGGQIEVDSKLGEGSCFTVNLPLSMAARSQ